MDFVKVGGYLSCAFFTFGGVRKGMKVLDAERWQKAPDARKWAALEALSYIGAGALQGAMALDMTSESFLVRTIAIVSSVLVGGCFMAAKQISLCKSIEGRVATRRPFGVGAFPKSWYGSVYQKPQFIYYSPHWQVGVPPRNK